MDDPHLPHGAARWIFPARLGVVRHRDRSNVGLVECVHVDRGTYAERFEFDGGPFQHKPCIDARVRALLVRVFRAASLGDLAGTRSTSKVRSQHRGKRDTMKK